MTDAVGPRQRRHLLRPAELAEAAVLGDVGLVLEVLGWFLPFGSILQALAIVPFALLGARHRGRAVLVATLTASVVAVLLGGPGIVLETAIAGSLGWSVGSAYRRGSGVLGTVGRAVLTTFAPLGALTVGLAALSISLRLLAFAEVEILGRDLRHALRLVGERDAGRSVHDLLVFALRWWWWTIPALELSFVVVIAALSVRYLPPFLAHMAHEGIAPMEAASAHEGVDDADIAPIPLRFELVGYRYPGAERDAVSDLSFELSPDRLVGLAGPNGSGKSTVAKLAAGRLSPSTGRLQRPGAPGLGAPGGTSAVFQRPESQVLGVRVRDDVVFGLERWSAEEVEARLAEVGLAGFEDRETATLSGGELQRLALAAALARRPSLVISDESTSMLDQQGRRQVMEVLRRIAGAGRAVLHVTHLMGELEVCDDAVYLLGGRAVARAPIEVRPRRAPGATALAGERDGPGALGSVREAAAAQVVLELDRVGYVYGAGTPWAHRALEDVSLAVHAGESIVVSGPNGSGKSTLAWVIAGLLGPTEGRATLDGEIIRPGPAGVGISFQHARFQLVRPSVGEDVAYAGDLGEARRALRLVGFDPDVMWSRRIDELSGGEQRRVALAGLLVTDPKLLVLDEPLAGLDAGASAALCDVLETLRAQRHIATVVIAHDLELVERLGRRVIRLEHGRLAGDALLEDSSVRAEGRPDRSAPGDDPGDRG
jgi:energy-coupling factor transporter ATP-binding protein EcfA2